MLLILAVLLLALILFGVGFAVHVLWWIALIVLALWLLGFLFRTAEGAGSRRRWYRWLQGYTYQPGLPARFGAPAARLCAPERPAAAVRHRGTLRYQAPQN